MKISINGYSPEVQADVFVAPNATLIGRVTLKKGASIWFGAVIRGDINEIVIGADSNIQDGCLLHVTHDHSLFVGDRVTVGHGAIVHACTVGDEVLVGMGSRLLDGVVVGEQSIIGAGALVTQGQQIPPGSLVLGAPAKIVRSLSSEERAELKGLAQKYVEIAAYYLRHGLAMAEH